MTKFTFTPHLIFYIMNGINRTFLAGTLLTLLMAIGCHQSYGQRGYQDVVYLKNGSVIRGTIIERIPDTSIKIKTGGSTILVEWERIEKMTKEALDNGVRSGYIGIMLGASSPHGDYADARMGNASGGSHLNLARFGYLFSNNLGVSAQWYGGANFYKTTGSFEELWAYGGMMVGLLYSPGSAKRPVRKWDFEISPMIGYAGSTSPDLGSGVEEDISGAFMLAGTIKYNAGKRVSLLFTFDWFYTKASYELSEVEQKIITSTVGVGVAYRLK